MRRARDGCRQEDAARADPFATTSPTRQDVARLETVASQGVGLSRGFGSDLHAAAAIGRREEQIPYSASRSPLKVHRGLSVYLFSRSGSRPTSAGAPPMLNSLPAASARDVAIFQEKTTGTRDGPPPGTEPARRPATSVVCRRGPRISD